MTWENGPDGAGNVRCRKMPTEAQQRMLPNMIDRGEDREGVGGDNQRSPAAG